MLIRSERDLIVHPSTRLAGTSAIEAEIGRRLALGDYFAVCYADLDHFKEFNDRYSYNEGDRVIRILAKLLHDVVKGTCGENGFIGHIGGDDFIFIIPYNSIPSVCGEIVATFDLARALPVFGTGSTGRIFFRKGPARPPRSRSLDDAVHRRRHQPPTHIDLRPAGEPTCDRDENIRQEPAWLGLYC